MPEWSSDHLLDPVREPGGRHLALDMRPACSPFSERQFHHPTWRYRGGVIETGRLSTDGVRQILLRRAAAAGLKGSLAEPISPHGLRAGFVTTAYRNGVPDEKSWATPATEP